jgi:putative redox protein
MIRASSLDPPYRTAFTNGPHAAVADVPVAKGGAGDGFGPHELLEAALATCLAMTARMAAAEHGFPLHAARCEVRIDRSVPGRATLGYRLEFDGPLTAEQAAQVREAAGKCPVARTLTGAVAVQPLPPAEGTG